MNEVQGDSTTQANSMTSVDLTKIVVGMRFATENDAYEFYNSYARSVGFGVRKHWKYESKKDKKLVWRIFCCSCQGNREQHSKGTPIKPRAQTRFNCEAQVKIELDKTSGQYVVVEFVEDHNHELVHQSRARMMRSHKRLQPAQKDLIMKMTSAGSGSSVIYYHMSKEAGGYENVGFLQSDCDKIVQNRRVEFLKKGDGKLLLDYFKQMEKNNKSFVYEFQVDENNQIRNFFWCDAKSRIDYQCFGDVVCFDTTYKTNDYDMPFAPILGVNNHGQTVMFGAALLNDETAETFEWVFETFLKAMGGKEMETIFTDQALAIVRAVKRVLPNTHHRWCIRHIYQNALRNLSHLFTEFESFSKDFKKSIYEPETEGELLLHWDELVDKYKLQENDWLKGLFILREKWSQVYAHEHFCAGMSSTYRSKSMNKYFEKYFKRKQILREFLDQFDWGISRRRQKEANADLKSKTTTPILVSKWPVEHSASLFYTRKLFNRFQEEVKATLDLEANLIDDDSRVSIYKVSSYDGGRTHTIELVLSDYTVKCTCKKIESIGILCSHALKVLRMKNLSYLPSQYLLHRWSKNATPDIIIDACGTILEANVNPALYLRYCELSKMAQDVVAEGSISEAQTQVAKLGIERVLDELRSGAKSHQYNDTRLSIVQDEDPNSVVKECMVEHPGRSLTLLAPPRKNHNAETVGRDKGLYDQMKKNGTKRKNAQ